MDQNRKNPEAANGTAVLFSANDALQDAVHGLEVRRVCGQVDRNRASGRARIHALGAKVILHISRAVNAADVLRSLELAEDLAIGFARDVGQDVEASAVRHGDGDFVDAVVVRGRLHDFVNQADC